MDLTVARDCFPGLHERVFLDAACVSLMPVQADAALRQLSQDLLLCPARDASAHHIALDRTAEQPRREIARLIGARPADIALTESTTQGLEIIASAVPLSRGDKILVGDTEFLGLAVPWLPARQRDGIIIETVPQRSGRLLVDDFARALDSRTRLILLSSVQWSTGFRPDLAAFSELAESKRVLLVVDAIQQLGAIALDVERTPVDFLVCGGHKWLNAPVGRGFLYIHPRTLDQLTAPPRGYLNIAPPSEGWAHYFATPGIPAVRDYEFQRGARAFEIGGTANYPGNVVLGASLALINELGRETIERHILDLTEHLIECLQGIGTTVVSPPQRGGRSGILTFSLGQGPERERDCLHWLWDNRLVISQRYTAGVGGLRVSVHFFNNVADVDRLVELVRAFTSRP
jgi:selenocysteine lyase/cysteine desulfurase